MTTTTSTFKATMVGEPTILADIAPTGVVGITFKDLGEMWYGEIRCTVLVEDVKVAEWHIRCPIEMLAPEHANDLKHACVFLLAACDIDPVELSAETIAEALTK